MRRLNLQCCHCGVYKTGKGKPGAEVICLKIKTANLVDRYINLEVKMCGKQDLDAINFELRFLSDLCENKLFFAKNIIAHLVCKEGYFSINQHV